MDAETEARLNELVEKAVAEYRETCRANIRAILEGAEAKMEGKNPGFGINTIDERWGDIIDASKRTTEQLVNEATGEFCEKRLIEKKKEAKAAEGLILRNKGTQWITFQMQNGLLDLKRTVLTRTGKRERDSNNKAIRRHEIIPLDEFLLIDNLPFRMTTGAMITCAEFGQKEAYASAAEALEKWTPIKISAQTLEKVTDYVGNYVYQKDYQAATARWENMARQDIKKTRKGRILYIMFDGGMLNTRRRVTGSSWHEIKVCIIYDEKDVEDAKHPRTREERAQRYNSERIRGMHGGSRRV